jgi:hypothetical protein
MRRSNLKLGLFLGCFAGFFKVRHPVFKIESMNGLFPQLSECLMMRLTQRPCPTEVSGFLAGLSMLFYRSRSLAVYTIWKTLEARTFPFVEFS